MKKNWSDIITGVFIMLAGFGACFIIYAYYTQSTKASLLITKTTGIVSKSNLKWLCGGLSLVFLGISALGAIEIKKGIYPSPRVEKPDPLLDHMVD